MRRSNLGESFKNLIEIVKMSPKYVLHCESSFLASLRKKKVCRSSKKKKFIYHFTGPNMTVFWGAGFPVLSYLVERAQQTQTFLGVSWGLQAQPSGTPQASEKSPSLFQFQPKKQESDEKDIKIASV